jgi:thiaminase/transcriptional activator TenA
MDLHRSYCAEFGIAEADLEAEPMAPTTRAYTDFLLRTASVDDYVVLLSALLPCMWGYSDLGRWLKERGLPTEERYARWIEMYASDEFAELAERAAHRRGHAIDDEMRARLETEARSRAKCVRGGHHATMMRVACTSPCRLTERRRVRHPPQFGASVRTVHAGRMGCQ